MPGSSHPVLHENLPLVEVNHSRLLDELYADMRAAQCLRQRLSPTVALVEPEKVDELLARLRKLDHTPKVIS